MSEKLSSSKPAVESDEKSKEIAHKSKECSLKEKKKVPKKRTMEIIETEKEVIEPYEITTELTINPEHSKDPEDPEDPEVPRTSQLPKTTSEISTSNKPKDPEDPEVSKMCELPKTTSEISTSIEKDVPKVLKVCQETSGEVSTSIKTSEIPVCQLPEISSVKFAPPKISECQLPKIISEIPTSIRLETSKIPEICHVPKTVSEISTSIKSEVPKVPKASQLRKTTSEIPTSSKPEDPKIPEVRRTCSSTSEMFSAIKPEASKIPEECQSSKTTSEILTSSKPEDSETSKECEMSDSDESISDHVMSSQTIVRRSPGLPKKLPNETDQEYRIRMVNQMDHIGYFDSELEEIRESCKWKSGMSIESHDKSETPTKKPEESSLKDTKSIDDETELMPIISGKLPLNTHNKLWPPISAPDFDEHPLVLATHNLIPSLPIRLFEVLAEVIEVITKKPVVLLHECRFHRPIASQIVDIVVMPAADNWRDGVLLPASFVFEHKLNKDKSANVYADVIVAKDRAPHIKSIMNLRGHRCAIPVERTKFSASGELFKHLHSKGENMLFFGNILDARTQIDVLKMVANNQADTGILESPVVECNKYNIPGVQSLHILATMGPLPPYRIMVKKTLADGLVGKLTDYLLSLHEYEEWLERLTPYGVIGFAENSTDKYEYCDLKGIASKIPYY